MSWHDWGPAAGNGLEVIIRLTFQTFCALMYSSGPNTLSEFLACLRRSSSGDRSHPIEEHISGHIQTINQSSILESPDEIIEHRLPPLWPPDPALECSCSVQFSLSMYSQDKLKNTQSQDGVILRIALPLCFSIETVKYKLNFYLFCGIVVDQIF